MSAPENTMALIEARLNAAFSPTKMSLIDESHLHAGHAGAQSGKGHYALEIHAAVFEGKTPIARHRMIYQALGELMDTHIHALRIRAKTASTIQASQ